MNYDFIIFGGTGLQGRICGRDLLESGYSVLLCGRDPSGIRKLLKNKRAGFMAVDLGGLQKITKEQFKLHDEFKKAGILCITGCGSTPGIVNIMAAYAVDKFDT